MTVLFHNTAGFDDEVVQGYWSSNLELIMNHLHVVLSACLERQLYWLDIMPRYIMRCFVRNWPKASAADTLSWGLDLP
jgi:hypothetical protein